MRSARHPAASRQSPPFTPPKLQSSPADARSSRRDTGSGRRARRAPGRTRSNGVSASTSTQDQRSSGSSTRLLDTLTDELTALNQEDMRSRTISLKAASHQFGEGIDALKEPSQADRRHHLRCRQRGPGRHRHRQRPLRPQLLPRHLPVSFQNSHHGLSVPRTIEHPTHK